MIDWLADRLPRRAKRRLRDMHFRLAEWHEVRARFWSDLLQRVRR